jgi:hydroxymethylglutaryl-CoA reductase
MVIEESSVVAAAANSARFWVDRGGFQSKVISTTKVGQVHFIWEGDDKVLQQNFPNCDNDVTANQNPSLPTWKNVAEGFLTLTC